MELCELSADGDLSIGICFRNILKCPFYRMGTLIDYRCIFVFKRFFYLRSSLAFSLERNPSNMNLSAGIALSASAVTAAQAPGMHVTFYPPFCAKRSERRARVGNNWHTSV